MRILAFIYIILFSFQAIAQTTSVRFEVNMNEQINQDKFSAATEFVDIAGSFNAWGDPNGLMLSDDDEDGIYTATTSLSIGSNIEFKARINGEWGGREEFAGGGPNRSHTVAADDIIAFWYNDEVPDNILAVDISASSYFGVPGEVIQFSDNSNGNPVSWEWTFEGANPSSSTDQNPVVTYASEGQYNVTLTITNAENESLSKTFTNFITIGNTETYWWNESVFYEIFVRSFYDNDGDGKGDFQGLIKKLDYLNDGNPATHNDLGITGIWLMPIQESPSYHGYDVTDYRKIEPDYGTNEDFKEFIAEAHKRGIKVIIDYVMNHSSSEHPWFIDSKNPSDEKRDWYVWSDSNPGGLGPWGQQVWHNSNGDYYYGIFWGGMPDLNYNSASLKDEMFDISTFWLEDMQADGFRLDAVKYIYESEAGLEDLPETFEFWKDFRNHYKSINEDAFAVGEAWTSTDKARKYVVDGGLDYVFEFDLSNAIINAVMNENGSLFKTQIQNVMGSYPYLQFGTFLTNHDINRIMDVLGNDEGRAKLAANFLLTIPGVPYLYYGEEIGMRGTKPDEDIRRPMQWNNKNAAGFTTGNPWRAPFNDFSSKNVENQHLDTASLWSEYHQLIAIRNNQPALQKGNYKAIDASTEQVSAYLRQFEDQHIIVVHNLSSEIIESVQLSASLTKINSGTYTLLDLKSGSAIPLTVASNESLSISVENLSPQNTYIFKVLSADALTSNLKLMVDINHLINNGEFDPATETVDLVSTENDMGNSMGVLSDSDKDGIYELTLENIQIGKSVSYKYRINNAEDDRAEFSNSDYLRSYRIQEGENVVLDVYDQNGSVLSNSNKLESQIQLYPNPAKDYIQVIFEGEISSLKYVILDMQGKPKLQGTLTSGQQSISIKNLAKGLYFVQLSNGKSTSVKKILVDR